MRNRSFVIPLLVLLGAVCACSGPAAQAGPVALPTGAGASITQQLERAVERGDAPGIVALVVNRDGVLYESAVGTLDAASETPMGTDAIINIFSMTKPITSVAVMMLLEQGALGLDDPVSMYLSGFDAPQVLTRSSGSDGTFEAAPAKNAVTVRHLLTHTSGIGYAFTNAFLARVQAGTTQAEWEFPLVHEPGEGWTYGANTAVLGLLVEKLSGQPLESYFQQRIFQPLGMIDTSYAVAPEKRSRVPRPSVRGEQGLAVLAPGTLPGTEPPTTVPDTTRGDFGLFSTAHDYGRFIRMLLNGGELDSVRILSENSVKLMGKNHIGSVVVETQQNTGPLSKPFPLGAGRDKFGLGFQIAAESEDTSTYRSAGSLSWAGILNTEFWIDPAARVGAVHLMQVLPFYDEGAVLALREFEASVYAALPERTR